MRKMYVDAEEVSKDWGVSKPKAYKMIKELNERMLKDNPNLNYSQVSRHKKVKNIMGTDQGFCSQ